MLARLKFDIDAVVTQMLDALPADVWTNPNTTFCDPSMAGGQIVKLIEQRLLAAGHSSDNVSKRVFGFEATRLRVAAAVNRRKLLGIYKPLNPLVDTVDRQFDVVITAPPFANNHGAKRWSLWLEYEDKIWHKLTHDHSYVAMITPISWQSPGEIFDRFMQHGVCANLDAGAYFDQGSTFSWWLTSKDLPNADFEIVSNSKLWLVPRDLRWLPRNINDTSLAINRKIFGSSLRKFTFVRKNKYHTTDTKKILVPNGPYRVFHTLAQELYSTEKADHYEAMKAMITLSGYSVCLVDQNIGCSQAVAFMQIDPEHADNARQVLNGQLYQYLIAANKWSGWNNLVVIKSLPWVDLSRSWTDAELYAYFGIDDAEIAYIDRAMTKLRVRGQQEAEDLQGDIEDIGLEQEDVD